MVLNRWSARLSKWSAKIKNLSAITTHCIIHRQALASKTPECFVLTMKSAIKVVNFIKNSASARTILDFSNKIVFWPELWARRSVFPHGGTLVFERKHAVKVVRTKRGSIIFLFLVNNIWFLTNNKNKELMDQFCEPVFQIRFVYLVNFLCK